MVSVRDCGFILLCVTFGRWSKEVSECTLSMSESMYCSPPPISWAHMLPVFTQLNGRYPLAPPCNPRRIDRWARSLRTMNPTATLPTALLDYLVHVSSQTGQKDKVTLVKESFYRIDPGGDIFLVLNNIPYSIYNPPSQHIDVLNIKTGEVHCDNEQVFPTFEKYMLTFLKRRSLYGQCTCPPPPPPPQPGPLVSRVMRVPWVG